MNGKDLSLDELTNFAIWIDATHPKNEESISSFDNPSGAWIPINARRVQKLSVGEVWRSVGSMILEAADDSGRRSKDIMPYVLQIIAHLHHTNALPSKIYRYTSPVEGTTTQRPPTLHFLSSRILTSLSDAVWRAYETSVAAEAAAVGARDTYLGHEVPGARYKVKVRELGPEIWMELVLWACLDCGLIEEGASILQELKVRSVLGTRWFTIPWTAVQTNPSPKDPHTPYVNWEQVKGRAHRSGAGVEGYSLEPPFIELGSRTISTEVVTAMVDALLSGLSVPDPKDGLSSRQILEKIADLHELLSRDGYSLGTDVVDNMVSRIVDYLRPELRLHSDLIKSIVRITTVVGSVSHSSPDAGNTASKGPTSNFACHSEAISNVLYSLLHMYAEVGDFRRANLVIQQLETISERAEPPTIESEDVHHEDHKGDDTDPAKTRDINTAQLSHIRSANIAPYVDLVVQLGELKSGTELLYSSSNSKRLISEDMYSEKSLTPALLRYAGATSDKSLLENLEGRISPPLSGEMLRAYLHCQVQLRRWDIVLLLLEYTREDAIASWDAEFAFRLARFIINHEQLVTEKVPKGSRQDEPDKEVKIIQRILTELLRGEYGPPESQRIASSRAQENYIECIGRMIQDASEEFQSIWRPSKTSWKYLRSADHIPVRAFNVLLQAVVLKSGSLAGMRMWEVWCQDINTELDGDGHDTFISRMAGLNWDTIVDDEPVYDFAPGVKRATWRQRMAAADTPAAQSQPPNIAKVTPNLATLQIIMRRALHERSDMARRRIWKPVLPASQDDLKNSSYGLATTCEVDRDRLSALIAWGREMYKAFGYDENEIQQELPGMTKKE
ncbi:MAG: hypothetical protein M1816_004070 [Peltula sp. TS41687]|nr:MAG: hypothetical protein M1816_004070 [Peltula sp. TS41687]